MHTNKWMSAGLCALALGAALLTGCSQGGNDAPADTTEATTQADADETKADDATDAAEADGAADDAQVPVTEPLWVVSKRTIAYEGDVNSEMVDAYTFDEHGSRVKQVTTYEDGTTSEITYMLDEHGYPIKMKATDQDGDHEPDVVNEVDENGLLKTRKVEGTTATYSYDAEGNLVKLAFDVPADEEAGYSAEHSETSFDDDGFITSVRQEHDGMVITATYEYERDDQGRPVSGTCTSMVDDEPESAASVTTTYEYDSNGNLVKETTDGLSGKSTVSYEYEQVDDPSMAAKLFTRTIRMM